MSNAIEQIRRVELGTGGPLVGIQGFGAMGISAAYGQTDDTAARDTLETTVEAGVTLIDTADMYGVGANEEFLAPFVAAHRDEITLATKFGIEYRADDPSYRAIRNDPAYIKKAVELNEAGIKKPALARPKPKLVVPDYFLAAIKKNKTALATFQNFSPSCQREYVEWITEAKREESRAKRIKTAIEWMAQGKPHNWKYR